MTIIQSDNCVQAMSTERKRVSFSPDEDPEIIATDHDYGEPHMSLWYSSFEFERIKSMACLVACQSQYSSLSRLLDGTFGLNERSKDVEKKLCAWSRHADSRRGLESMVNRRMHQNRRNRRSSVVRSVMTYQEQLRQEKKYSYDEEANLIAHACSRLTSPATQFAIIMGKADAKAAKHIKMKADRQVSPLRRAVRRPQSVSKAEISLIESPRSVMDSRKYIRIDLN